MNFQKVVIELQKLYPGKSIIKIPKENPLEIICEVEPSSNILGYSLAVAIIDKSAPHKHLKSTENYKVIKGKLNLFIENQKIVLKQEDSFLVKPNKIHWAEGNETWIEVKSTPGWTSQDHILK